MKALFRILLRASPFPVVFCAFLCYSAEFQPAHGYANLREESIDKVEITYSMPTGPYSRIGMLVVRDFPGDLQDPSFVNFIQGEAKRHGASGAWIAERTLKKGAANLVQLRGRRGYEGSQTSIIEGDIAVVKIILFVRQGQPR